MCDPPITITLKHYTDDMCYPNPNANHVVDAQTQCKMQYGSTCECGTCGPSGASEYDPVALCDEQDQTCSCEAAQGNFRTVYYDPTDPCGISDGQTAAQAAAAECGPGCFCYSCSELPSGGEGHSSEGGF